MGNRQTVGIAVIVVGTLLVIGAVRGTWKNIFAVALGQTGPSTTPTAFTSASAPPTNTGQTILLGSSTYQQQTSPNPNVATY